MATEPIITNKRVDDIPVLLTQMGDMGLEELMDKHSMLLGYWEFNIALLNL